MQKVSPFAALKLCTYSYLRPYVHVFIYDTSKHVHVNMSHEIACTSAVICHMCTYAYETYEMRHIWICAREHVCDTYGCVHMNMSHSYVYGWGLISGAYTSLCCSLLRDVAECCVCVFTRLCIFIRFCVWGNNDLKAPVMSSAFLHCNFFVCTPKNRAPFQEIPHTTERLHIVAKIELLFTKNRALNHIW